MFSHWPSKNRKKWFLFWKSLMRFGMFWDAGNLGGNLWVLGICPMYTRGHYHSHLGLGGGASVWHQHTWHQNTWARVTVKTRVTPWGFGRDPRCFQLQPGTKICVFMFSAFKEYIMFLSCFHAVFLKKSCWNVCTYECMYTYYVYIYIYIFIDIDIFMLNVCKLRNCSYLANKA